MRIGYLPDTHGTSYDAPMPERDDVAGFMDHLLEAGRLAEEVGFDGLWVPERHMRTETYWPNQMQLLTALASRTDSIKLGTFTNVLSLHNPMKIAEQISMIDNLSKGRFIYSGAIGYHDAYWRFFGIPDGKKTRLPRFREALEIIKKAFDSGPDNRFSYHGDHFQLEDVFLTPAPYQNPRPPIWVGGQVDPAIERSGKLGEAWPLDPFPLDEETFNHQLSLYKEAAREHGNPRKVVLMRDGFVSPTRDEALRVFGRPYQQEMLFYFRQGILSHHPDFETEDDLSIENLSEHMVIGSPADCIEALEEYEEKYDIDYVVMRFRMPEGPTRDKELECIGRFGEEVIPHFHKQDDGEWLLND